MSNTVKEDRRSLADILRNYLLGSLLAGFAVTMGFKLCGFNHINDAFLIIGCVFCASLVGPLVGLLVTRRLTFGRFALALGASMMSFFVMGGMNFARSADAITAFYRQAPLAAEFGNSPQFADMSTGGVVEDADLRLVAVWQQQLRENNAKLSYLLQDLRSAAGRKESTGLPKAIDNVDKAVVAIGQDEMSGADLQRLNAAVLLTCAVGQRINSDVCEATSADFVNARQIIEVKYPVWVRLLRKLGSI